MTYNSLLTYIDNKYHKNSITEDDIDDFKTYINKHSVKEIITEIIGDDNLLQIISERSYGHTLGFDKIVLIDLNKDSAKTDRKVQLRLHIWNNEYESLPIVESMHEHSFDFISTVLTGELENQRFNINNLSDREALVFNHLTLILPSLSSKNISLLNDQLEIIEAMRLSKIGSSQLDALNLEKYYNPKLIQSITGLSADELLILVSIEGHFVSNRKTGQKEAYKHILDSYVSITPEKVLKIKEGEYYFHPYQLPHRLFYDNTVLNSTILITTPVEDNPQGGSLQRPTYVTGSEKSYSKINLSKDELKRKLKYYISII